MSTKYNIHILAEQTTDTTRSIQMENGTQEENNTIYITNMKWHMTYSVKSTLAKSDDLPDEYSLSIPGYLV